MAIAANKADSTASPGSRYLTKATEVRAALQVYRDQLTKITLRFANQPSTFQATILDVTDKDLLIEDIQPRSGLRLLRDGNTFSISCRSLGQYVHADDNRVHRAESDRGLPYFHVKLPKSMLYQQRRRDSRVNLPLQVRAEGAMVTLARSTPVIGEITNLSAGGCQARIPQTPSPALQTDEVIEGCTLFIRNQLELSCQIQIRHYSFDRSDNALVCGLEFLTMPVTDRRRLEQFVQTFAKIESRGD